MKYFILVVVFFLPEASTPVAITTTQLEFASEASCLKAREHLANIELRIADARFADRRAGGKGAGVMREYGPCLER